MNMMTSFGTPAVAGYTVQCERTEEAGRWRIDLFVHPEGEPSHHVAMRVDLRAGREPTFHAGFAAAVREVCLPEHLDPQERAVEAAAEALRALGDVTDPASLVEGLHARWSAEWARLTARQSALAKRTRLAQRLYLDVSGYPQAPVLLAERTRLGRARDRAGKGDHPIGVFLEDGRVRIRDDGQLKAAPLTQASVAKLGGLSGHERLALLASAKRPDPRLRRALLDAAAPRAVPLARTDWIAAKHFEPYFGSDRVQLHTAEGASGSVSKTAPWTATKPQPIEPHLQLLVYGAGPHDSISIRTEGLGTKEPRPPSIQRRHGKEWFAAPEALDAMMRLALEMLLTADLDLSDVRLVPGARVLTPEETAAHPLLAGLDVPAGMLVPLGTILGTPYEDARRRAERAAARAAKMAAKVTAAAGIVDDLPEGTLLGRVDTYDHDPDHPSDGMIVKLTNKTKLGIVRTVKAAEAGGAPKRVIRPVYGLSKEVPLDATRLAKMPPIRDPFAFREMQDLFVGGPIRDRVETAFRLSLRIPKAARNPLFGNQVSAQVEDIQGLKLRHFRTNGGGAIWAAAFAIMHEPADIFDALVTGAGFVLTVTPEGVEHYLRPARAEGTSLLPETHRAAIADAVQRYLPERAETALAALDTLWARGPHTKEPVLWA